MRQISLKQIQAIIRPEKLEAVKDVLVSLDIKGLTTLTVQGFGRQLGHTEVYRGVKVEARLLPKVMLTLAVNEEQALSVIEAIARAAYTGEVGDGKVIVTTIDDAIRIRTGERGSVALT